MSYRSMFVIRFQLDGICRVDVQKAQCKQEALRLHRIEFGGLVLSVSEKARDDSAFTKFRGML